MYFFMMNAVAFLVGMIGNGILRNDVNELLTEAEHIDNTRNSFFKQLKLRYENSIRLGHEISNTQAFADKYLGKYRCHGFTLEGIDKAVNFCGGLCVVLGLCGAMLNKNNAMEYLLVGFLAMYVVVGAKRMIDVPGKIRRTTVNIVDYFENRCFAVTSEINTPNIKKVSDEMTNMDSATLSDEEKRIIDEILREYLG